MHPPVLMLVFFIAVICYGAALGLLARSLLRGAPINVRLVPGLIIAGLIAHALTLIPSFSSDNLLEFTLFDMVSLTSWLMLYFSLIMTARVRVLALNALAAGVALIGISAEAIAQHFFYLSAEPHTMTPLLALHVIASIAAYSLLFMAAVQAFLLLQQNRELKHRRSARWVKLLPPLQSMERLLKSMLVIGFGSLSVALVLGFFAVQDLFAQHLAHKTVFSLASWLLFAWLLFSGYRSGFRAQRMAKQTLVGFVLLAIGFFGSKFVLQFLV